MVGSELPSNTQIFLLFYFILPFSLYPLPSTFARFGYVFVVVQIFIRGGFGICCSFHSYSFDSEVLANIHHKRRGNHVYRNSKHKLCLTMSYKHLVRFMPLSSASSLHNVFHNMQHYTNRHCRFPLYFISVAVPLRHLFVKLNRHSGNLFICDVFSAPNQNTFEIVLIGVVQSIQFSSVQLWSTMVFSFKSCFIPIL